MFTKGPEKGVLAYKISRSRPLMIGEGLERRERYMRRLVVRDCTCSFQLKPSQNSQDQINPNKGTFPYHCNSITIIADEITEC